MVRAPVELSSLLWVDESDVDGVIMPAYPFNILIGEQLSAVTFVQDYLQLHFDGPFFNLFKWPELIFDGLVYRMGDVCYRDILCSFIGDVVFDVTFAAEQQIDLVFANTGRIIISTTQSQDILPETVMFYTDSKLTRVWVS